MCVHNKSTTWLLDLLVPTVVLIFHTWIDCAKFLKVDFALSFSISRVNILLEGPELLSLSNSKQKAVTSGIIPSNKYSSASLRQTPSSILVVMSLVSSLHPLTLRWVVANTFRTQRTLFRFVWSTFAQTEFISLVQNCRWFQKLLKGESKELTIVRMFSASSNCTYKHTM